MRRAAGEGLSCHRRAADTFPREGPCAGLACLYADCRRRAAAWSTGLSSLIALARAHRSARNIEETRAMTERPLPAITPETRHFWEGAPPGRLGLQKCTACTHVYFPPRPFCPKCASREVAVVRASGRASLYSY